MSEKIPFVTKEQLEDIASRYATPFYLYDEKGIRETARRVNKAFSWNKGFKEYFAVKATPTPGILKILHEEGCGADCSSYTELLMADAVGFKGDEIMFSSNDTPAEDFQLARKLNATINLDDITHIDFLERVADIPDTVCCRYNPGGTFQLGESKEGFQVMDKPGDAKYGMTEADAYKLCQEHGLLSPIYAHCRRNGCWFCPNASDSELLHMVTKHPDMFDRLIEWENEDNIFHRRMTRRETPSEVKARLLSKSQTGFSSPKSK